MATQTNFDWNSFNQSLDDTRRDQQEARARRDAADSQTVGNIVSSTAAQANDRAAREAARESGVYDQVYGTPGSGTAPANTADVYNQNASGYSTTRQGLGGTPTRPGAEGYQAPQVEADPYGAYTPDISSLDPYKYGQNELNRRNNLQQIAQATAGGWETGSLAPSQRQKGEAASPWDALNEKLGAVADTAEKNRVALKQQFDADQSNQSTADFNAREKQKLANDYSRKDAFNEIMNDFNKMIDKYSELNRAQTYQHREVVGDPYTLALDEFRKKYGGDPPDERNLTSNSMVNDYYNRRHTDLMNQYTDASREAASEQQRLLQSRLQDPSYGLNTNDGWQYGSGTDTGGIWSL